MVLMDGNKLSVKILEDIKNEYDILKEKTGVVASLAVLVCEDDFASKIYVKNKERVCKELGFSTKIIKINNDTSQDFVISKIEELNKNEKIHGILVQLPLPTNLNEKEILLHISPDKDVDGFHPLNLGKMLIGDKSGFSACTPYGIMQLFKEYNIEIEGKLVTIVGRSNIVGKPMALMLIEKGATVIVCNSKTKNLHKRLKEADIVISATGVPNLINKEDIKNGAIVIDVGINRVDNKLCGDVNFEEVSSICSYITPVPKGVGPMTVASLMKNTFKSYKKFVRENEDKF